MASKSVTRAITGNNGSYSRILGNFRGVDLTSDPSQVAPDRMAYSVNMWRDYESENGGAIETIPGFRKLFSVGQEFLDDDGSKTISGPIHGIFSFGKYLVVHSRHMLFRIPKDDIENFNVEFKQEKYKLEGIMRSADSSAFEYNDKLYILDGTDYRYITADSEDKKVYSVANSDAAYIPTSYYNYKPYEQRNMLQKNFINKKTFLREVPVNNPIPVSKNFEIKFESVHTWLCNRANPYNSLTEQLAINIGKCHHAGKIYMPCKYSYNNSEYILELVGGVRESGDFYGTFANTDVEQVVIDGDIIEIPPYCFANCKKLKRVVIKGSWIGGYAPEEHAEKNPYNVIIKPNAFYGCENLTEIWFFGMPRLVFGYSDGDGAEYFKNAAKEITVYGEKDSVKYQNKDSSLTDGIPEQIKKYEQEIWDPRIAYVGEKTVLPYKNREYEIIPIEGESGIENLVKDGDSWNFTTSKAYAFSLLKYSDSSTQDHYLPVFIYDKETNVTNYEGELWWYNFTIMDPCTKITDIKVSGNSLAADEYVENKETLEDGGTEYVTSVDILLPRSYTEEDVEIYGEGELNNFATVKDMADIYQSTTLSKERDTVEAIGGCTVSCAFDGRVFFTGNPELPNTVFYTQRDNSGANNPTYIGVYNYINDGVGSIPNVAMIASSSMLMVFKQDTTLEGSVFYHTGQDNADTSSQDLIPRIYPSVQGVAGIGCLGAACNFADDAVFISKKGLEAIGKEQVNLERTIQHRSGRIDASLWHTIGKDTKLAEWKGYLVVLTSGGRMYLADSRSLALMRSTGEYQYEWFFLDGIGSYIDDKPVYTYVDTDVAYLSDGTNIFDITDLDISKATETEVLINEDVKSVSYNGETIYFEEKSDGRKLLVEKTAERSGGTFSPACAVMEHDGNLYFGCKNGDVCVFNTDKRGEPYKNPYSALEEEEDDIKVDITEIHPAWYNRCGHRYISGFSTLADNCGYPHFNKSTCGKTLTIKAKNMRNSAFSLRARTNREDWKDIERYVSARHDLSYLDFANANFQTQEQQIFSSREKMKKWAEKQLYFFSDGFCEPFGIYNLAYVFEIVGKVK